MRKVALILLIVLTLGGSAWSQTFGVFHNVLENGWQDWSWCDRDLASTDYEFSGENSARVTYTAGYQGFFLAFPTGALSDGLTSLTFEINGGAATGRSIAVAAYVNGSALTSVDLNKYLPTKKVLANQWTLATIPLKDLGLTKGSMISGFWLQESSGSAQPSFYLSEIGFGYLAPPARTLVTIDNKTRLHAVDQKMLGVNVAVWDSGLASSTAKSLIAQGGYQCFRFPGGSLSDGYHWATNTTDNNTWQWVSGFDTFASMSGFTNGQCFITVNYGTGTPAEAAAWVKYSNVTKGYGYKYWEVGNECFGGWEEDGQARAHDPVIYATRFAQYYQAMKAVDPTIMVGAVAVPGEDDFANYSDETAVNPRTGVSHHGWTPLMLSTLAGLGVKPDFLSYHRYPQYINDCDYAILTNNGGWGVDIPAIRQQLSDYMGTGSSSVQIMCTESNSDSGPNGKQSTSLVNGLYLADAFGALLQTEAKSYVWWDLLNGVDNSGDNSPWLYGWRKYGDLGMISTDFTQQYPTFFVAQLLSKFTQAGDEVLPTNSAYPLLTCFATRRSDGTVRVMVVNKNPVTPVATALAFSGLVPQPAGTVYQYGIPQDTAASMGLPQQIQTSSVRSLAPITQMTFPPYSVTVIVFTPTKIQVNPTHHA